MEKFYFLKLRCHSKQVITWPIALNYYLGALVYPFMFLLINFLLLSTTGKSQSLGQGPASFHSIEVTGDGKVYSWGHNDKGQLGIGNYTNQTTRQEITAAGSLKGKTIISTVVGYSHSLALADDGTVHAWGFNLYGQLGTGNNSTKVTPVWVESLTNVVAISAGYNHSIVLKGDGTVYAFGSGFNGELGDNIDYSAKPWPHASNVPVQVQGLTGIRSVTAGHLHNLALKNDGTIYAWGHGGNGKLGDGFDYNRRMPVQVKDVQGATAIAAGGHHSLAIASDGTVIAWGAGGFGQLGNGFDFNSWTAVRSRMTNTIAISSGIYHCFALKSDGTVYTWGNGINGEHGMGNITSTWSKTPLQVPDFNNVAAITSGFWHNLALKTDGNVYAWGLGSTGQLGSGATSSSNTPVPVIGPCVIPALDFNASSSCLGTATMFTNMSTGVAQGAVFEWDFNGDNIVDNNTDQNPSYTYTAAGMHTVNLTIRQGTCSATITKDVIVEGPPADVRITDAPSEPIAFVSGGITISLNGSYVDDNISEKTITWKWDENNEASTTTGILTGGNGTTSVPFQVSGNYNYTVPGVYKVTLTITDNCGSSFAEHRYVVIYDPNGGFVTGGGWIDSPPGAYTLDINLTGKATFGFVSKYKNGSSIPVGQTEFQFRNAQLNFKSSNYEDCSLVVGGHKAKYKGIGTVEGMLGSYNFIVSVIDGQISGGVDKFRIRIWNGGGVLYDNNVISTTQGEDSDPVTALGGGSIVIHKSTTKSTSTTSPLLSLSETDALQSKFFCYPTAFSDKAVLAFSLENEEEFTLEVYDLKGTLVKQVKSGTAKADKLYEYELNGKGMANGLYIARLSTGKIVQNLKLVLER